MSIFRRILPVLLLLFCRCAWAETQVRITGSDGNEATGFLVPDGEGAAITYHWGGKDFDVSLEGDALAAAKSYLADSGRRHWVVSIRGGGWQKADVRDVSFSIPDLGAPTFPIFNIDLALSAWSPGKGFAPGLQKVSVPSNPADVGKYPVKLAPTTPKESKGLQYASLNISAHFPFAVEILASDETMAVVIPSGDFYKGNKAPLLRVPVKALATMSHEEWKSLNETLQLEWLDKNFHDFLDQNFGKTTGFLGDVPAGAHMDYVRQEASVQLRAGKRRDGERPALRIMQTGLEGQVIEKEAFLKEDGGKLFLQYDQNGTTHSEELWRGIEMPLRTILWARDRRFSIPDGMDRRINSELQSIIFHLDKTGKVSAVRTEHTVKRRDFNAKIEDRTEWHPLHTVAPPFAEPAEGVSNRPPEHQRWVLPLGDGDLPIVITKRVGDKIRFIPRWQAFEQRSRIDEYEVAADSVRFVANLSTFKRIKGPAETYAFLTGLPNHSFVIPEATQKDAAARWEWLKSDEGRPWPRMDGAPEGTFPVNVLMNGAEIPGHFETRDGKQNVVFSHAGKKVRLALTGTFADFLRPQIVAPDVKRWAVPIEGGHQNMERRGFSLKLTERDGQLEVQNLTEVFGRRQFDHRNDSFGNLNYAFEVTASTPKETSALKPPFVLNGSEKVAVALTSPESYEYYPIPLELLAKNATHVVAVRPSELAKYETGYHSDAFAEPILIPLDALRVVSAESHQALSLKDKEQWSPPGMASLTVTSRARKPEKGLLDWDTMPQRRPEDVDKSQAREKLAFESQLKLIESQSLPKPGRPEINVVYRDSNGGFASAPATLQVLDDDHWTLKYTKADGTTHVTRVGQPSNPEKPDFLSALKQITANRGIFNSVPNWPVGYTNANLLNIAVRLDAKGDVEGMRALHDYVVWDWKKSGQGKESHPARFWFDADDVRGAFKLPNGPDKDRSQPATAQRFVVVNNALKSDPKVTPVVVISHDGKEVKVAIRQDWEALARGTSKELKVFTVPSDAVRFVPDKENWQELLDGKIRKAEFNYSSSEIYLNDGRLAHLRTEPFSPLAEANRYYLKIAPTFGEPYEIPVWVFGKDGDKVKAALYSDWKEFEAGKRRGELKTLEIAVDRLRRAESDSEFEANAEKWNAKPDYEKGSLKMDLAHFKPALIRWFPLMSFVRKHPPYLISILRSYFGNECPYEKLSPPSE